ncbi:MAG: 3-hydroxyisobutyrate dehydrogenase [Herminiimonas sp.]|nr:3-hydroxyisobutyrate dehydrogenase [Herminiimonas sp.]
MNIGIIGTGRMGAAIGQRLLDCGHTLTVWNRTLEKTAALQERGARAVASPAEVVKHSDVIISILTDASAIENTYGDVDVFPGAPLHGKLFIEMSTVRPETQIALGAKIAARGGAIIDCPVGGSVGPARDGKLFGLVGGADADVARARPLLEQMCRRVEHVGPSGAGASLKLAINLPLLVFYQSFGEALSLASSLNIDPARLLDIFSDTSGAPAMLKLRAATIASALAGNKLGSATFNVDSIRKDMRTMQEEARALGWELPVTSAALKSFDEASQNGLGDADGTQLPVWWLNQARGTGG